MQTLAVELAVDRIRVNSIAPTQVDTPMLMNPASYRLFHPDLENPTADDMVASFNDPDGNGWLLQEITTRLPGR